MSVQTAVRIPDETYARLKDLAEKTGRTATYYIKEAIEEHLEDIYLAEQTLDRVKRGEDVIISAEEFWSEMED